MSHKPSQFILGRGRRFNVTERHCGTLVHARRRVVSEFQDCIPLHEYLGLDGDRSASKVMGTNSVSPE